VPSSELFSLTGVGPKRLKALEAAGIRTFRDLVYHVPRRYVDRTRLTTIAALQEGDDAFFTARIESVKTPPGRLLVTVSDDTGIFELAFFNSALFLRQQLIPGRRLSVAGVVKRFRTLQISHPEWEILREDQDPRGGLLPVYPLTESLAETRAEHKLLQKLALETLETYGFTDPLTPGERAFLRLRPEKDVLKILHAPESLQDVAKALNELKVRELWPLSVERARDRRIRRTRGKAFPSVPEVIAAESKVRASLPFTLTAGQEKVLKSINEAMSGGENGRGQFYGLLHGDVGSGKTAVALLSAVRVAASGSQVSLLAPTEILALQHFRNLAPWLAAAGLESALLTGETAPADRRRIESSLADGTLPFVVGTHALLSGSTLFKNLRYVLVDEQHRFGVEQRTLLTQKGVEPHVLYLSATPIPRTLAQTLYGDMEVLTLTEKPAGRLPVKTRLVPAAKQAELLEFLRAETRDNGNQVYWVVPRIGMSQPSLVQATILPGEREGFVVEENEVVAAVDGALKRLQSLGDWKVEAVHGRVPSLERDRILSAFRRGEIHGLVATTVIEVGVDVPGANIMVVEGAERFGMAQLHQLRGRTGRGAAQAWCFLLEPPAFGWPEETEARLREFASTEDGFAIAEMDLRRRGAGSLDSATGTRQSGFGLMRFADVLVDADLIRQLGVKAEEFESSQGG
jgi:ATP-dependent DNA helicase RecG